MAVKMTTAQFRADVRQAAFRGIVRATEGLRKEVVKMLAHSSHSGEIYIRRGIEHQRSAPGEPPAVDTGRLLNSIRTEFDEKEMVGRVIASTGYAGYLEFGTQKMEPRPFMRPSLENQRDMIMAVVKSDVTAAVKKAGKP